MIRFILYNLLAFIVLTFSWIASFIISQNSTTFPRFSFLSAMLMIISLCAYFVINITIFKKRVLGARILISLFLTIIFTLLWYTTNQFSALIACNIFNIPFQSYLAETQSLLNVLVKIDNSPVSGFIFSLVFLTIVFCIWYWVIFKNGAETWKKDILEYNKKFGIGDSITTHPFVLKISGSIMLGAGVFFVYVALMSLIK